LKRHVFHVLIYYLSSDTFQDGLQAISLPTLPTQLQETISPNEISNAKPTESPSLPLHVPQKRKFAAINLEIPDSEGEDDEDYGWAEEDEEDIPPPPPQWQGSEDILVPPAGELEGDDEGVEEEEENGAEGAETIIVERVIEDSEDELA